MTIALPPNREVHRGDQVSVQVLDEVTVQSVCHDEPYAVIGVVCPVNDHPPIRSTDMIRGYLKLKFYDDVCGRSESLATIGQCRTISASQATRIRAFVKDMRDGGVNLFVCHCEAGISRSAAIAKYILAWCGDSTSWVDETFAPNWIIVDHLMGFSSVSGEVAFNAALRNPCPNSM